MLFIWLMSDSIILDLYILKAYLIFAPRTWTIAAVVLYNSADCICYACVLYNIDIGYYIQQIPQFSLFIRIHVLLLAQKWQTNDLNAKQVRLLICSCKINIIKSPPPKRAETYRKRFLLLLLLLLSLTFEISNRNVSNIFQIHSNGLMKF